MKEIALEFYQEDGVSNTEEIYHCLDALKELESIIQPLSIEFGVKYRYRRRLAFIYD